MTGVGRFDLNDAELGDRPRAIGDPVEVQGIARLGTVGEVASAVVFLASPAAALVTGSSLLVDGGWTAW